MRNQVSGSYGLFQDREKILAPKYQDMEKKQKLDRQQMRDHPIFAAGCRQTGCYLENLRSLRLDTF